MAVTQIRVLVYLALFLILGTSCSKPPEAEQAIRQSLKAMERGAESKDSAIILDYLSEDFLGNNQFRKINIKGMLFIHFRRNRNIHVFLHDVSIQVKGASAEVSCQVILAGRGETIIPERARVLEIKSDWQRRDGDWRIVSASWKDPYYQ